MRKKIKIGDKVYCVYCYNDNLEIEEREITDILEDNEYYLYDEAFINNQNLVFYHKDKDYLMAIYLLSKCRALVAGRTSGSVAAMIISEGYEDIYFWNRGRYGDNMEEYYKYSYLCE